MEKKIRRQFSDEEKKKAVEEYVSGRKPAAQVCAELGVHESLVYKWRVQLSEKAKGARVDELEAQGMSSQAARKLQQMEAEIEEYQKKVAQQAVIIDLLKKLQTPSSLAPENELTGLIDTTRKLARSKRHVK